MIAFRRMAESDIPAGLALCRAAGWNQTEQDWRVFLKLAPETTAVAMLDGAIAGTVAILDYGTGFAWLSMLLVDPAVRGRGVGTALFEHALQLGEGIPCIRLDATPEGRRIYCKYGFSDEYELTRWEGNVPLAGARGSVARGATRERAALLDREVFGADRSGVLFAGDTTPAVVDDSGFALARHGFFADHVGPVVATNSSGASAVLQRVLRQLGGRPVILDVPDRVAGIVPAGFTGKRKLIRMSRGINPSPGRPEMEFAIRGPEFG